MEFISKLFSDPFITMVLGVISSIIVTFYYYKLGNKKPSLAFVFLSWKSNHSGNISDILVYNAGPKPIKKEDIASIDPIKIKIDRHINITSIEIKSVSRKAINPKLIKLNRSLFELSFDFLDDIDNFMISVIHNSRGIEEEMSNHFKISGTIIGAKPLKIKSYSLWSTLYGRGPRMIITLIISLIIGGFLTSFLNIFYKNLDIESQLLKISSVTIFIGTYIFTYHKVYHHEFREIMKIDKILNKIKSNILS